MENEKEKSSSLKNTLAVFGLIALVVWWYNLEDKLLKNTIRDIVLILLSAMMLGAICAEFDYLSGGMISKYTMGYNYWDAENIYIIDGKIIDRSE